ncbi:predicted protein [Verticillium alfalfae VaMs.102]|uniref:Predicted protein n=1 Tax=Verticillium alfalfae (strain VaMs.102 / ATCC MYA-4576 / FGSC 10136) TaxID=526221 RepID=C9S8H9_VERA1|nr:predicted protein [Verticillium alfalfae VaMs.102]EEY13940.1 predicted protein [Verticillium alfalfae VaMs.102]
MASEAPAEPVKRGRGRPRKPDSEKKQKPRVDDGTPRRGRGRPKGSLGKPKVLTAAAGVSKSTSAMNTRSTGTRGRPRKSDAAAASTTSTTKAAGATQTPSKRGRGRPRKSDAAASSPAVEREEPESAASEADVPATDESPRSKSAASSEAEQDEA